MIRPVLFKSLLLLCCLLGTFGAHAKPENVTRGELALLPEYCPFTQSFELAGGGFKGGPSTAQKPWVGMMGDSFWGLHHYCWALIAAQRASASAVPAQRAHLLRGAISDAHYTLEHSTADFQLRPEVLLRMGQWQAMLGNPFEALQLFEASRAAKPDYWPAYLEIAKLNVGLKRPKLAQDALEAGLIHIPGHAALELALRNLKRPSKAASAPKSPGSSPRTLRE